MCDNCTNNSSQCFAHSITFDHDWFAKGFVALPTQTELAAVIIIVMSLGLEAFACHVRTCLEQSEVRGTSVSPSFRFWLYDGLLACTMYLIFQWFENSAIGRERMNHAVYFQARTQKHLAQAPQPCARPFCLLVSAAKAVWMLMTTAVARYETATFSS